MRLMVTFHCSPNTRCPDLSSVQFNSVPVAQYVSDSLISGIGLNREELPMLYG